VDEDGDEDEDPGADTGDNVRGGNSAVIGIIAKRRVATLHRIAAITWRGEQREKSPAAVHIQVEAMISMMTYIYSGTAIVTVTATVTITVTVGDGDGDGPQHPLGYSS
jgi:hypothetical protein